MKKSLVTLMGAASSALALCSLAPAASAAGLSPGNYLVNGVAQICLRPDGTWYSETYPNWGGQWQVGGWNGAATVDTTETFIWGSVAKTQDNDSLVVTGSSVAWTEWFTGGTGGSVDIGPITLIKARGMAARCTPAPTSTAGFDYVGHPTPKQ